MNRHEFIKAIAKKHDITIVEATKWYNAVMESLFEEVVENEYIHTSFGTFSCVTTPARPARVGRNPRTGESINIKAKPTGKRISFKMSKSLKEEINNKK